MFVIMVVAAISAILILIFGAKKATDEVSQDHIGNNRPAQADEELLKQARSDKDMRMQALINASTAVKNKRCAACGSDIKIVTKDIYACTSTGLFPWVCRNCGEGFHLDESYPTSYTRVCTACGEEGIEPAH